jgi:hypothetical protein
MKAFRNTQAIQVLRGVHHGADSGYVLEGPNVNNMPSRKTWGLSAKVGSKMISGIGKASLFSISYGSALNSLQGES